MILDVTKARRPFAVRLATKGMAVGSKLGLMDLRLDAARLKDLAERMTGLKDWRSDSLFEQGLDRLLWSVNNEAGLDAFGKFIAKMDIRDWLTTRLRYNKAVSEARNLPRVDEHVFIIGFARIGSTLLHNLLALDSRFRAPRLFELIDPAPYPRKETYETDPRVAETDKKLRQLDYLSPLARRIHPMEAALPDECRFLMDLDFVGPYYCLYYNMPSYWEWVKACDYDIVTKMYRSYEEKISYLCTDMKGIWLSKSSVHLYFYPILTEVFPNAKIVRLHRDPIDSIASTASLIASYRLIYTPQVDLASIGKITLDLYEEGMNRTMAASAILKPNQYIDVHYKDLVQDPIATCRRIYHQFDYPANASLVQKWRSYMEVNKKDRHGKHAYSLTAFGLSEGMIRERLKNYYQWMEQMTTPSAVVA